jgi:hypothetical protein
MEQCSWYWNPRNAEFSHPVAKAPLAIFANFMSSEFQRITNMKHRQIPGFSQKRLQNDPESGRKKALFRAARSPIARENTHDQDWHVGTWTRPNGRETMKSADPSLSRRLQVVTRGLGKSPAPPRRTSPILAGL